MKASIAIHLVPLAVFVAEMSLHEELHASLPVAVASCIIGAGCGVAGLMHLPDSTRAILRWIQLFAWMGAGWLLMIQHPLALLPANVAIGAGYGLAFTSKWPWRAKLVCVPAAVVFFVAVNTSGVGQLVFVVATILMVLWIQRLSRIG